MSDKTKPNTIVYAYHGPLIYEAKVLKIHEKNKSFIENGEGKHESLEDSKLPEELLSVNTYLLHYQGWKSKWDEWVTADRLLEYNEENRKIKKELDEATKRKKSNKKQSDSRANTFNSEASGETRVSYGVNANNNNNNNNNNKKKLSTEKSMKRRKDNSKQEITIRFPMDLKYLLVDDWEFITKNKQLISVPCEIPVSNILKDYYEYRKSNITDKAILNEIINGLDIYFNKSLSLILLYKFERLQYLNFIKEGLTRKKTPSQIYGFEHLLRLFVSLPGLIGQTTIDPISIGVLIHESEEILKFLLLNLSKYTNKYINTSPTYDSLARS